MSVSFPEVWLMGAGFRSAPQWWMPTLTRNSAGVHEVQALRPRCSKQNPDPVGRPSPYASSREKGTPPRPSARATSRPRGRAHRGQVRHPSWLKCGMLVTNIFILFILLFMLTLRVKAVRHQGNTGCIGPAASGVFIRYAVRCGRVASVVRIGV
jgi:hypothetical protein